MVLAWLPVLPQHGSYLELLNHVVDIPSEVAGQIVKFIKLPI